MRPHDPGPRDDPGRARLLLATELGWLRGYPLGREEGALSWQIVPTGDGPSKLRVDGERLHRASWALRQIHRDHLAVLESVLDEPPARWRARTQLMLDLLSDMLHGGAPAPDPWATELWEPRLQERARALPAELGPLVRALGWRQSADPAGIWELLDGLAEDAPRWIRLLQRPDGLLLAMVLLSLSGEERRERLLPVLDLLLPDSEGIRAWRGHAAYCEMLLKRVDGQNEEGAWPRDQDFDWAGIRRAMLLQLVSQPRAERRRGLQALALLSPKVEENVVWWRRFAEIEAAAAELPERQPSRKRRRELPDGWRDSVRARILDLQAAPPCPWRPDEILDAVMAVARSERMGPMLLSALPLLRPVTGFDAPAAFLVAWTRVEEGPRLGRHVARWARSLRRAAAAGRLDRWLNPWTDDLALWSVRISPMPARKHWLDLPEPDDTLLESKEHATERFYDWLDSEPCPPGTDECRQIALNLEHTEDAALARRLFRLTGTRWLNNDARAALVALARVMPDARLRLIVENLLDEVSSLPPAVCWFEERGHGERLSAVRDADLVELGRATLLLQSRGRSLRGPDPRIPGPWLDEIHPDLRPALEDLARWWPEAERWARRAIDELAPPDEALDREIAALEARVRPEDGETPLSLRLQNLRDRRATPRALSEGQRRKLAERARTLAATAFVDALLGAARVEVAAVLPEALGVNTLPDWSDRPDLWRALGGLGETSKEIQTLAWRVLRHRAGPPPWDLREETPNRRFLDRLRARGVKLEPWLGERSLTTHLPGGEPVTLSFEADPVEILQMGAHFNTCLSPGGVNFFSAVVNAADINKRVIYARGPDRRVVGRCLVALTDEGDILPYEPYCHRSELDFPARVYDFVVGLARDMGAAVRSEGEPRALMASRWYDDGVYDLAGGLTKLNNDSPLVKTLPTLPPELLLSTLRDALHPAPIDGQVLGRLIHLEVIQARVELLMVLAPEIQASRALSLLDRTTAAACLWRGGAGGLARQVLPRLKAGPMQGLCCGYQQFTSELLEMDPWFILSVLKLRGRHEFEPGDAFASGRALETLGRPAQALQRYQQTLQMSEHHPQSWKDDLSDRIARLSARLERERERSRPTG